MAQLPLENCCKKEASQNNRTTIRDLEYYPKTRVGINKSQQSTKLGLGGFQNYLSLRTKLGSLMVRFGII